MSIEVLEIGYGNSPAFKEGSFFQNANIHYTGLDLPSSFNGCWVSDRTREEDFSQVVASMHAMPFRNEAFDYVLMRSVYGQFDSQPEIVSSVRLGIFECMRVLKKGGTMVIAEENTPRDLEYTSSELTSAGFLIAAACYMSNKNWDETTDDDRYRSLRKTFYTSQPAGAYGSYFGTPNIVIGSKPDNIELRDATVDVITNFYKELNGREDWDVRTLPFKFPVRKD